MQESNLAYALDSGEVYGSREMGRELLAFKGGDNVPVFRVGYAWYNGWGMQWHTVYSAMVRLICLLGFLDSQGRLSWQEEVTRECIVELINYLEGVLE